eukprot:356582_1
MSNDTDPYDSMRTQMTEICECIHTRIKHRVSHILNGFFLLTLYVYGIPFTLIAVCYICNESEPKKVVGLGLFALGIMINTISLIILLHVFGDWHEVHTIEIIFASYWIVIALLLFNEARLTRTQANKTERILWSSFFVSVDETQIPISYKTNNEEKKNPNAGVVFHYVLISLLTSITVGYIAAGVLQLFEDGKAVSSFEDFYQFFGVILANIFGGYKLIDFAAIWFVENYWDPKELMFIEVDVEDS